MAFPWQCSGPEHKLPAKNHVWGSAGQESYSEGSSTAERVKWKKQKKPGFAERQLKFAVCKVSDVSTDTAS